MIILLADDERMVRLGLQSMLEELFPGKHTYIHARNGKEVIKMVQQQIPDLVFLDIKMPLIDGFQALESCKQYAPFAIWVILSGYADFEYARQSLTLSVFDYLVKPVDIQILKNLFDRIAASQRKKQLENNTIFAHDIIHSFNIAEQFSPSETDFLPAADSDYILYQFYPNPLCPDLASDIKQRLHNAVSDFCDRNSKIIHYCLFFNSKGNLCLVCDIADATWLTHFITILIDGFPPYSLAVFWGNNKKIRGIYEISKRIDVICDIRLVKDCSKPVFFKNLESLTSLRLMLSFAQSVIQLTELCLSQNQKLFTQKLRTMQQNKNFYMIFPSIDLAVFKKYLTEFFHREFIFDTFDSLLDELGKCFHCFPLSSVPEKTSISQIQDYIYENYMEDVSLSRISELFHLSPSYLSKLFHEKTGQKYIDFVTQVRIEYAIKIISSHPSISIKQVSEMVGYSSVRHFSRAFQKCVGTLPSNYRSQKTSDN